MHVENKRKGKGHGGRRGWGDIYKKEPSIKKDSESPLPAYLFCVSHFSKVVSKTPENSLKEVWLHSSLSVGSAPDSTEPCSSVECHDNGM